MAYSALSIYATVYMLTRTIYAYECTKMHHCETNVKKESPAVADKPARRESMPKLLKFDVLTTLSMTILVYLFRLAVVASDICEIPRNSLKIQTYRVQSSSKVIDLGVNRKRILCNYLQCESKKIPHPLRLSEFFHFFTNS